MTKLFVTALSVSTKSTTLSKDKRNHCGKALFCVFPPIPPFFDENQLRKRLCRLDAVFLFNESLRRHMSACVTNFKIYSFSTVWRLWQKILSQPFLYIKAAYPAFSLSKNYKLQPFLMEKPRTCASVSTSTIRVATWIVGYGWERGKSPLPERCRLYRHAHNI